MMERVRKQRGKRLSNDGIALEQNYIGVLHGEGLLVVIAAYYGWLRSSRLTAEQKSFTEARESYVERSNGSA
jgi:hypothetical protein